MNWGFVKNMKKIVLDNEPNYESKMKSFIYQSQAVDFAKDLDYAAIFHEQGLGKTKISCFFFFFFLTPRNWKKKPSLFILKDKKYLLIILKVTPSPLNKYPFIWADRIFLSNLENKL